LMDPVYRAVESGDLDSLGRLLSADVCVLTPEADGVLVSRDDVLAAAAGRLRSLPGDLHLEAETVTAGEGPGTRAAWVFDVVTIRIGEQVLPNRVRMTSLMTRDSDEWRVAACYWSVPFATQAEQDAVKHAGLLEPGAHVPDAGTAPPYAAALANALGTPALLPALYSPRQDHVTIGSVVDEVFLGPAGKGIWEEFVTFVSSYSLRGPVRGAAVTDDVGWLVANIDIGQPPTPYRFFYVWLREDGEWRIVVSHDGVSRRLDAASFR
jgi:ketosteroid isomerase-like protein